jgi:putative oxidoreductase
MTDLTVSSARPIVPAFTPIQRALAPYADLAVRAAAGLFLMPHGAQKLFGAFGGYGLEASGQFFSQQLGLPASFALLAGLIEFVGGLALAFGLLTRVASGLIAGLMVVAAFHVHLANGFFWTEGGFEYPLLWAIVALSFVVRGGGRLSVDALIGREI